jgi:uncharacterized protein (TIGR03083 family)
VVIFDWTVTDMVVHLTAGDGLFAAALGLPVSPPPSKGEDLYQRTVRMLEREGGADPREAWLAQATAISGRVGDAPVRLNGLVLPAAEHATGRAFETWIHGRDIALRTGMPPHRPPQAHLHAMADLSVRLLSVALGRSPQARITLTGRGGGVWELGEPRVELDLDVHDFCLLAGDRVRADTLERRVRGDAALADEILSAVPRFAGP